MSLLSVMRRPTDKVADGTTSNPTVGNEAFMTSNRFYTVDDECV